MATHADPFPQIALKHAESPDVVFLFEGLAARAEVFARMQDEFTAGITKHREAREGKPLKMTTIQQRTLANYERDAEQAKRDIERFAANMDDAALLTNALSGVDQQIQLDEHMFPGWHDDDKPMARKLLDFQRETKALIERFVESSPFKDRVKSIWHGKQITKRPA